MADRPKWLGIAALTGLLLLAACAGPPREKGQWRELPMRELQLAPVALDLAQPPGQAMTMRICRNAREGIQRHLVRVLPGRLDPVGFRAPGEIGRAPAGGSLEVSVVGCRLESHQWDVGGGEPDITFYLTVLIDARLRAPKGDVLFRRRFQTVEQVHTDIPTPVNDFFHVRPARRVYGLFSQGRYWSGAPEAG